MDTQVDAYADHLARAHWTMARVVVAHVDGRTDLVVEAESAGGTDRLRLRFGGVVGLVLRQQWSDFPVGLQVVDMVADGWEGVAYRVTDPEYDILSFQCAEFEVDAG
jgi:hypothetical protein